MDADSIVIGNVCERFHECWHGRFNFIYCQFSAGTLTRNRILGYLAISSSYIVRDVFMYATEANHVSPMLFGNSFLWWGRLSSAFILKSSAKKPLEEIVIKKVKTKSQGSSRQSANSGKSGFLEFLRYEDLLKSSLVCKMKYSYIKFKSAVKIWEFLKFSTLVFSNL